jgi:glycosyltransferase involved in cell wall biosynthesis
MPEVLRVIARLNLGGPARHVLRIHEPLARRGWRTTLVAGQVGPDEQDLTDEARRHGIETVVIPELGRAPRPLADVTALRRLRALIRARRPDVVHTHTAKAGTLGRLATLGLRRRPACVHTFHGHVLSGYFGPMVSAAVARAERSLARRTQRLVAVSQRVRDELLARGVGSADQYAVVPPGIDIQRTTPDPVAGAELRRQLGLADGTPLVGLVGRLAAVKDPLLAVEAFARRDAFARDAHLLVMGDGALGAPVRAALASRADATWLPPRHDTSAVWGALDLCLLTSRNEGLPQVATEALAAGVPVLAPDVGGLSELVTHGHDGLVVPREELATALSHLLGVPEALAALKAGAAGFDATRHGAEAVAEALSEVYAQALAAAGGESHVLETDRPSGHAAAPCGS